MRRWPGTSASPSPIPSLHDLLPLLKSFQDAHPSIRLRLAETNDHANPPDVDIALRITDAPPEALVGRQLRRLHFALQGTAERCNEPQPRWILWRDPMEPEATLAWQQQHLAAITRAADIALEVSSHADALAAARAGFGLALLAEEAATDLVAWSQGPPLPPRSLWLLTHPDLRRSGRVRAFMEHAFKH